MNMFAWEEGMKAVRGDIARFRGSIPLHIRMWLRKGEHRRVLMVLVSFVLRNCRVLVMIWH